MSDQTPSPRHTNRILVCCGARPGNDPGFVQQAEILGTGLGQAGYTVIYGGGNAGLMGALGRAVAAKGGTIIGYGLEAFLKNDGLIEGVTLSVVADLFERKEKFLLSCDASIILPGGIGTLDEIGEMAAANDLQSAVEPGVPMKPIILINYNGFYDHLLAQLEHSKSCGFTNENQMRMFTVVSDAAAAIAAINAYNANAPIPSSCLRRDQ